jgi:hypothetical protein
MSHLSRDERLQALDGVLDASRAAHLETCPACRGEVDALGAVLARVRAVDVPEPSPLFWDHLAARVGEAIAREPAPGQAQEQEALPWWRPRLAWAAVAVVVTAAASGYLASRRSPHVEEAPQATAEVRPASVPDVASTAVTPGDAGDSALEDDGSWDLIAAMVDEDAAESLAPHLGQSELSISALSADERAALAGELRAMLPPGVREG